MSVNGLHTFNQNLRKMMASDAFKKADFEGRGDILYRLLNSRFGLGSLFGFGDVEEFPKMLNNSKVEGAE